MVMTDSDLILPPDGRQSETALMVARGTRRLLTSLGFVSVTEVSLASGRRADLVALADEQVDQPVIVHIGEGGVPCRRRQQPIDDVVGLVRLAAVLAREAVEVHCRADRSRPRFVAGAIGPMPVTSST